MQGEQPESPAVLVTHELYITTDSTLDVLSTLRLIHCNAKQSYSQAWNESIITKSLYAILSDDNKSVHKALVFILDMAVYAGRIDSECTPLTRDDPVFSVMCEQSLEPIHHAIRCIPIQWIVTHVAYTYNQTVATLACPFGCVGVTVLAGVRGLCAKFILIALVFSSGDDIRHYDFLGL